MEAQDGESDESFARRLQGQQYATVPSAFSVGATVNAAGGNNEESEERILARARGTMYLTLFFAIPQVIAACFVLGFEWDDTTCESKNRYKWKVWVILHVLRMFVHSAIVVFRYSLTRSPGWVQNNPVTNARLILSQHSVDFFGLVWFFIGNLWIFSHQPGCSNPFASPLYQLCFGMVILNYVQICLPCVLAALFLPLVCICMPCLIRILARIQDPRVAPKGATTEIIDKIPLVIITAEHVTRINAGESMLAITSEEPKKPDVDASGAAAVSSVSDVEAGCATQDIEEAAGHASGCATKEVEATDDIVQDIVQDTASSMSCPICLCDMAVGDAVRVLKCSHFFHKQCVDEWLHVNANCPSCRCSINEEEAAAEPLGATQTPPAHTLSAPCPGPVDDIVSEPSDGSDSKEDDQTSRLIPSNMQSFDIENQGSQTSTSSRSAVVNLIHVNNSFGI